MTDVLELIEKRQSRRTPFDAHRALPKEALREILEAARWSPTAHNMQNFEIVVVLYDPSRRALASEGDFLGIMSLGCVMQNMWLTAESLGIGFQILSAFSSEHVEGKVKMILDIPAGLKIDFTARLGYPVASPHELRVRRDLADFVHRDRYGNKDFD